MNFETIKSVLKEKSVGIAGCGGLGSNCAVALARVGVGKLIICDFDVVSETNLNRQYFFYDQLGQKKALALQENINRINPFVTAEAHDIKLNAENITELFHDCDVIVEAFDRADMKKMILETVLSQMPDKPLVSGIGLSGWGNSNSIQMKRTGNLFICGDGISEATDDNPPLAPRVGIAANMQANTVLEILLSKYNS
ncbi:MAG TPA: sulfur carrier protein ThiS adenylyltransferase ThiF [Bacteroidales bacterium]|nr:sulfur carrier protein ThiS adenylyltransferase ThiF [Bacteroidales bacterium]